LAFMLAGTTSTNPALAILGVLLILAWKNAGFIGLDRYLLPILGTPWTQPKPARDRHAEGGTCFNLKLAPSGACANGPGAKPGPFPWPWAD
ncbi:MAG TPA: hypothetical protein VGL99_03950, partial [Chloroflexota bacterium]